MASNGAINASPRFTESKFRIALNGRDNAGGAINTVGS
jgi:hypothetical protein